MTCLGAGDLLTREGDRAEGVYVDDAQPSIDGQVAIAIIDTLDGCEDDVRAHSHARDDHAATLPKGHDEGVPARRRL